MTAIVYLAILVMHRQGYRGLKIVFLTLAPQCPTLTWKLTFWKSSFYPVHTETPSQRFKIHTLWMLFW